MRMILSLFLVLLFVAGCTPEGGEIARNFVEELEEVVEELEEEQEEEEIDCSDPLYTTHKPLPEGTNPLAWESLDNQHWSCPGIDFVFRVDGSFTSRDKGDFSNRLSIWETCRIGRRPPDNSGQWVITADDRYCQRFDSQPGSVSCFTISLSPKLSDIFILRGGGISDLRTFEVLYQTSDGLSGRDRCYTREGSI